MKVVDAEFVISAVSEKQYPKDDLPEFALAGRSNVGKSSLINTIVNRRKLARTSQQPGKTQTLNFIRLIISCIWLTYQVMAMQKFLKSKELLLVK